MFSRQHGLIFLPVPKNANSFLKAIFLMNHEDATDFAPEKHTAHWYLNPARRLVSGYLKNSPRKAVKRPT
jgi:hypothetical protein